MEAYFYTILIILMGLVLILLDIAVIPGGIVGTAGGILILVTIYYCFNEYGTVFATHISIITVIMSGITVWIVIKFKLWTLLQHKETAKKEDGYISFSKDLDSLIGKTGVTVTPLRPSGRISIDNRKYDCISQGNLIDKDKEVTITAVSSGQLVVRVKESPEQTSSGNRKTSGAKRSCD